MLALLAALTVVAPQVQDFRWTGQLAAGQRVTVQNIIGDVSVEPASGRQVEVTATRRAGRYGNPEDVEITAEETSTGVRVCVRYPGWRDSRSDDDRGGCRGGNSGNDRRNRNDTEVTFVIRLPAGVRVEAATVAGNVDARQVGADAELTSVSGNVELDGFSGVELHATTVSGDVTLRNVRGRRVEAETVSGDVGFEGVLARDGRYDLTTLSGSVLVDLPAGAGAEVRASTFSGRIRMPAGMVSEASNRRRTRASGRIGAGGASLNLESFSGNVDLRIGR
jgi:hypothetical protein